MWNNRVDLQFQTDWRGAQLQNLYILVCKHCLDVPQQQLRAITLPADPVPIYYPSPEDFEAAETNYRAVSALPVIDPRTGLAYPQNNLRVTQDCQNRTTEPFGIPVGFSQAAVMPLQGTVAYGVQIPVLSVVGNGTATVTVTCSAPHGLQNDSQISVQGLTAPYANGFYSVSVTTATQFTYMTYGMNPDTSLLTDNTRIVTCNIGLPLGYRVIPKITGPSLVPPPSAVCFFELENGQGIFLLENGSGYLTLEQCNAPAVVCYLENENGTGQFLLENGGGFIQLEQCGQVTTSLLETESGGTFTLEGGFGSIELENGP
jgi:hypothetical protein